MISNSIWTECAIITCISASIYLLFKLMYGWFELKLLNNIILKMMMLKALIKKTSISNGVNVVRMHHPV